MKKSVLLSLVAVAGAASSALAQNANVRVFHGSPDAPAVDVVVNDGNPPAVQNLAFRSVTGYLTLPAATYNFKVRPAGLPGPDVINANVPLASSTTYTVAAINTLSSIAPAVFVDDNTLDALNARIRFIHASPNAPAVDIGVQGGGVLFSNVTFGNSGGYISVPGGVYNLEVRLAGTSTVVLPLPGLSVSNNTVYTAWAVGLVGGTGNQALDAQITQDAVIPAPAAIPALLGGALVAFRRRRAA
ncbi:MAG TPA: DUF4397 domain-containing protein [Phycisphaerales bacterium]|nr:DUF4397 domain-containing protein [Phycisphaerales bacterium]